MNRYIKTPNDAHSRSWVGWIAAAAIIGSVVNAQETAADKSKPAAAGEPIVLSPFVVSAEQDHGYAATSSLAGTRLNTSLNDIAASISVVTKDMMTDLGVNNSAQLLTYTLGTEVSGSSGSFSGASVTPGAMQQDGVDRSFLPNARIRGLASADNTRDFFLTDVPWDGFNTDRVEVNRGPNAMLFGTGSPAGIINQTTSKAILEKDSTEVKLDYGRFGSTRAVADNNTVLIKDRLALRTALKYSDDRFMQKEAFIRDKRGFAAATYKPFELTTIRADYEQGRQSSVKPEWRPPFDLGVMSWFEVGKPIVNPLTGMTTLTGTATAPVSAVNSNGTYNGAIINGGGLSGGGWGSDNPALVFDQPDRVGTTIYGLSGLNAVTNRGPGFWGPSLVGMQSSRQYQQAEHAGQVGAGAYTEREISNPAIFDFYDHLLEGSNKPEGAEWHVFTASIEQLLPNRDGGVEFAYNHQYARTSFNNPFNWESYGIGIDMNTVLLNGSPNPNLGRPVIASDSWSTDTKSTRNNQRLTAFYTLQVKSGPEWLRKLIGTHTVTANYSDSEAFSVTNGGRALVAGPEYVLENPNVPGHTWSGGTPPWTITNGAARGFQSVVYLGGTTNGNDATGMNIRPITVNVEVPGVNTVPVYFYNNNTNSWQTAAIQIQRGTEFDKSSVDLNWTGGATKSVVTSRVFILHSSMLDDTILPTIGYREDRLKFYNAPGDILNVGGFSESKAPLPTTASSIATQHSFNWGAVARLPRKLEVKLPLGLRPSIFYNTSDNFSPSGQRINIFGRPIDPSKGTTKEYGFLLSALDEKISLRFTHYKTALTGTSIDMRDAIHSIVRDGIGQALGNISNGANDANPAARDAFLSWWNSDPLAANIKQTFGFVGNTPTAVLDGVLLQTTDSVSKGNELELAYNPTKNWRLALNASKSEVVNANSAADAYQFLTEIQPVLNGPAGSVWIDNSHRTWAQSANTFVNTVNGAVYGDGHSVNPELRKYRFNALTNYTFNDGVLKDVGVGGAVRYADKVLIGTGYKTSVRGDIPDYSVLYYGPSEVQYDGWVSYRRPNVFRHVNWELQLNVRNIGVGKHLIPVAAQPDGTIANWRIAEPMTWTLSSKFDF